MVDEKAIESRLRKKLRRFLAKPGKVGLAISVLKNWEHRGWGPILFGGVIRDLVILGGRYYPRDVDVVLRNVTTELLAQEMQPSIYRLNRFGGLHLNVQNWAFDVWPLEKTWAFTADPSLQPTVENLPKTTFLDVEAIAVTLNGNGGLGQIYSNGFFQAVIGQCVDINHLENPFPALCAIRAVIVACKLRYQISPRLADYFVETVTKLGAEELVFAQEHHYKKVVFRKNTIDQLRTHFARALDANRCDGISLPDGYYPTQLTLWPDQSKQIP